MGQPNTLPLQLERRSLYSDGSDFEYATKKAKAMYYDVLDKLNASQ